MEQDSPPGALGSNAGLGPCAWRFPVAVWIGGDNYAQRMRFSEDEPTERPEREPLYDAAYAAALVAAERERCALQVPTNWLDPLLTGPDSVVPATTDCRVVERLLRAVQERIRGPNGPVEPDPTARKNRE